MAIPNDLRILEQAIYDLSFIGFNGQLKPIVVEKTKIEVKKLGRVLLKCNNRNRRIEKRWISTKDLIKVNLNCPICKLPYDAVHHPIVMDATDYEITKTPV